MFMRAYVYSVCAGKRSGFLNGQIVDISLYNLNYLRNLILRKLL